MPRKYSTKYQKNSGKYTKFKPISKKRAYSEVSAYNKSTMAAARLYKLKSNQIERKTFDAISVVAVSFANNVAPAATPFAPVSTASGGCLNQIPLGNSSITRIGRRVTMKAVQIRGTIEAGSSGTISRASVLLIWDRTPNQSASLPPWTSILTNQYTVALTNKDYASRFKILRRWDYGVVGAGTTAAATSDNSVICMDEFIPLKDKVTVWTQTDTTGLYPTMMEGALLLYTVSDDSSANTFPSAYFSTRVYFDE